MPETTNMTITNPEFNSTKELSLGLAINPDARLIQACDEYYAAEAMFRSFFHDGATPIEDDDARHAAQQPYRDIQADLMEIIGDDDIRALTLEGMRARARASAAWAEGDGPGFEGESFEIVACLLNDLVHPGSYKPGRTELSADFMASDGWMKAIGKAAPSLLGDAN